MEKETKDRPLSESSVSHRLVDIQRRCSLFMEGSDDLGELSLEDASPVRDNNNPYNRGG